jgi:hypothetical protein
MGVVETGIPKMEFPNAAIAAAFGFNGVKMSLLARSRKSVYC